MERSKKRTISEFQESIKECGTEEEDFFSCPNSDFQKKSMMIDPNLYIEKHKKEEQLTFESFSNSNENLFFNNIANHHINKLNNELEENSLPSNLILSSNPNSELFNNNEQSDFFDPFSKNLITNNPFDYEKPVDMNQLSKNNNNPIYCVSNFSVYNFKEKKYKSKGTGTVSLEVISKKKYLTFRGGSKNVLFNGLIFFNTTNYQESEINKLKIVVNKLAYYCEEEKEFINSSVKISFRSEEIKDNFIVKLKDFIYKEEVPVKENIVNAEVNDMKKEDEATKNVILCPNKFASSDIIKNLKIKKIKYKNKK